MIGNISSSYLGFDSENLSCKGQIHGIRCLALDIRAIRIPHCLENRDKIRIIKVLLRLSVMRGSKEFKKIRANEDLC